MPESVTFHYHEAHSLMALQGPKAESVLQTHVNFPLSDMPYMTARRITLEGGAEITISRLGYTGEDGFEISIPDTHAADLWRHLCEHDAVEPIGLAARDSLRLEMGLSLIHI